MKETMKCDRRTAMIINATKRFRNPKPYIKWYDVLLFPLLIPIVVIMLITGAILLQFVGEDI